MTENPQAGVGFEWNGSDDSAVIIVRGVCDMTSDVHEHATLRARFWSKVAERGRPRRGERNGCSKLTESDVRAIRADARLQREIAAAYGVSQVTVSNIRRRKVWSHVQ